ncbi:MAG: PQQ-dependent sugar dehydrogenase [Planctomycetota bacterium]|jgi:uncharacterized repeat protein (TIGR03806 family)
MVRAGAFFLLLAAACGGGAAGPGSAPPPGPGAPAFGLTERVEVTGLRFPLAPPAPGPVQFVDAFANLSLPGGFLALFLTAPRDGSDRIFVVDRAGRIAVFPNTATATSATTFLDLRGQVVTDGEMGLLGLAFDPQYALNGYFYVHYNRGGPRRSVISRFRVSASDPDLADAASEIVLLEVPQPHGNHNGGMIAFGPDDLLYTSLGDGGIGGDPDGNGQDRTNLLGTVIRIDPHGGTPYSIPGDNPFVGAGGGVREEIYAYGFRNPWRFSFDRGTGDLWLGDVGVGSREEIDVVFKGGNYGWNVFEGNLSYENPTGLPPSQFEAPVHDYGRAVGGCVIGGYVYRGSRAPALVGAYVYADCNSAAIRALTYDGNAVTSDTPIGTLSSVFSFGEDEQGELYAVRYGGSFHRLQEGSGGGQEIPSLLSDTGLFRDTTNLVPAPGLIEYDVNSPLWSDGARKRRWIALPGDARIGFSANGPWVFPVGTVLVKHFELDLAPTQVQRLETRVLVHENAGWAGYTYRWNFLQTDATLLADAESQTYSVEDPAAPGGRRDQTWDFPSRAQCLMCHTEAAGHVLGVRTRQLNRDFAFPARDDNQLRAWNHIRLFDLDIGEASAYDALPHPADDTQPLAARARSYLDVNCAPCHQPGSPTAMGIDLRYAVALRDTNLVDVRPQTDLGLPDAFRIKSGVKESSVSWERLRRLDTARMPPLGSNLVHDDAVALVGAWIDQGPVDR